MSSAGQFSMSPDTMKASGEVFVGIDTAKARNAVAVAEGGREGEVRYLGAGSPPPDPRTKSPPLPAMARNSRSSIGISAMSCSLTPTRASISTSVTCQVSRPGWSKPCAGLHRSRDDDRKPLAFTLKSLEASRKTLKRLDEFIQKLYTVQPGAEETAEVGEALFQFKTQFKEAMDDDLNISLTLSALFKLVRAVNPVLVGKRISASEFTEIDQVLRNTNSVLQILDFPETGLPEEVQNLLSRRETARQRKEFVEADRLRDQICARGYRLIDLKDKTLCTQCSQKEARCPE